MQQPDWLTTFSNDQVTYGFDDTGLWFQGDADDTSYPVRTNFDIPQNTTTTIHLSGGISLQMSHMEVF